MDHSGLLLRRERSKKGDKMSDSDEILFDDIYELHEVIGKKNNIFKKGRVFLGQVLAIYYWLAIKTKTIIHEVRKP